MKRLEVRLSRRPGEERIVGRLAESGPRPVGGQLYFEYDPAFLRDPLWLSPFKLPPQPGLVEHRDYAFGPIFGLFDDSLPDGWGLLLMDRFFQQRGSALAEVSVLDRLAYLGTRTMGALTYHPPADPGDREAQILDLHQMARASRQVIEGTAGEVLPQLLRAGGSPGGARPKVLVGVYGDAILSGEDDLPPGFTHWIVKLQAREDSPDVGPGELAYSLMAKDAGLATPSARLFETRQGERFFGVERFDRKGNHRYHVHTFGNLIHANHDRRRRRTGAWPQPPAATGRSGGYFEPRGRIDSRRRGCGCGSMACLRPPGGGGHEDRQAGRESHRGVPCAALTPPTSLRLVGVRVSF